MKVSVFDDNDVVLWEHFESASGCGGVATLGDPGDGTADKIIFALNDALLRVRRETGRLEEIYRVGHSGAFVRTEMNDDVPMSETGRDEANGKVFAVAAVAVVVLAALKISIIRVI
jgi:hypothetical protein